MSEIKQLLARYFDDDNAAALQQACRLTKTEKLDIADLLEWVQNYAAEPEQIRLALLQLRRALGLNAIPGAVCRPQP